jgi:hypothetical protein
VARVYCSSAGFYIGSWCQCGAYSRESGYFATRAEAEAILAAPPSDYARSTELEPEPPLHSVRLRHHLEVLSDALARRATLGSRAGGDGCS